MSKPTVFISYSHKDEVWKDRLETQLRVLQFEGLLETWTDRQIDRIPPIGSYRRHFRRNAFTDRRVDGRDTE